MREESSAIKQLIRESGLDPTEYADVAELLAALDSLVPDQPPRPSRELAAMIARGSVTPLAQTRSPRSVLVSGAVAAAVVLAPGVAAATNSLPDPVQRFMHEVSERFLPFEFPAPVERDLGEPVQLPAPARNATDQGKHVGAGTGGGKTGNLGQHKKPERAGTTPARPATPEPSADPTRKPADPGKPADLGRPAVGTTPAVPTPTARPTQPPEVGKPSQLPAPPQAKPTQPPDAGEADEHRSGRGRSGG